MEYKEALETISGALAIANAECRSLREANRQLKAENDRLLSALEAANIAIRELSTRQGSRPFINYQHREPANTAAKVISLRPASGDK